MKKTTLFSLCMTGLVLWQSAIYGVIVDTKDIRNALHHAESNTLYVFDLDNTLIEPNQILGSDQWVSHMLDRLTAQGFVMRDALQQVIPCWMQIQQKTRIKLVDPAVHDLFKQLKKKKISYIGLSKRDPQLSDRTIEQLDGLAIEFHPASGVNQSYTFENLNGTVYKKGVIFVAEGIEKGPCLVAYLNKLKKKPARIVVIDDKMSHIQNIGKAIESLGIPFIGIRYGRVDEKVKAFNPQIADIQLDYFNKILSDDEAQCLLQLQEALSKK